VVQQLLWEAAGMEGVLFPLFLDQFFDEMPKWD
jgi:hypothetical protein